MSTVKANMTGNLLVGMSRFFTGMRVRYTAELPKGSVIYYANHTSHLDGLAVWSSLPRSMRLTTRPIAAKDYWDSSKLKRYIANDVFNALLIDRKVELREEDPIEKMLNVLNQDESLIIFPEGTRGDGSHIAAFKSGLYHLAQARPDIPLVPVYLHNLHRVLPKGSKLIVPILCKTIFGAPITINSSAEMYNQDSLDHSTSTTTFTGTEATEINNRQHNGQNSAQNEDKSVFLARAQHALEGLKHVV